MKYPRYTQARVYACPKKCKFAIIRLHRGIDRDKAPILELSPCPINPLFRTNIDIRRNIIR